MSIEFVSKGYFSDRLICYGYDLRKSLVAKIKSMLGRNKKNQFKIKQRYSERYAKNIVLKNKLAVTIDGKPSWFYTAFERGDGDPLTNYSLEFIEKNILRDSKILVTGCGTGITVFHIADCGFQTVIGSDLLPECIKIANQLKNDFRYDNTSFLVDDGFNPTINEKFDVITALHWVFSAWMGNYGGQAISDPFDNKTRIQVLNHFFSTYSNLLNPGGILIVELTDAVADYRLPNDHPWGENSKTIYPIRHTPEQVNECAQLNGMTIIDKKLCISFGHQPRTAYYLKKN